MTTQVASSRPSAHARAAVGRRSTGAADLGDDVVVVRVEPLGHLPRLVLRRAARQRRQGGEGVGGQLLGRPGRGDAQHHRRLQHGVVQEVVVGGRAGQLALLGEVRGAELRDACVEALAVQATRPGALQRPLQLAVGADARIADQLGGDGHGFADRSAGGRLAPGAQRISLPIACSRESRYRPSGLIYFSGVNLQASLGRTCGTGSVAGRLPATLRRRCNGRLRAADQPSKDALIHA